MTLIVRSLMLLALLISLCSAKWLKDPIAEMSDVPHTGSDGEHNAEFDHEVFLGGEDEAAQYAALTPEQSKQKLAKLLKAIDKDSDEVISEDELKEHIIFMQNRYVKTNVENSWQTHNTNHDDKMFWSEYFDSVYGPDDIERPRDETYESMVLRDKTRFEIADMDKSGFLDESEYACFIHPETCDHMKDIVVKETVLDIDKDGDGLVDEKEYIGDLYHPEHDGEQEPGWVKEERRTFHEKRDHDKDGKMNHAELREWIMPEGFDHALAETRHLIGLADDDDDQKLTFKEILDHYDVFVGSQATDYGDQLYKHDPSEF